MNRSFLRSIRIPLPTVGVVLGGTGIGVAAVELALGLTGQFVTAILIVPVIVAAWFSGLTGGILTIVLQTALVLVVLPWVFSFSALTSSEMLRLVIATGVSAPAMAVIVGVRHSERRFHAVVSIASEGIWTIDADGRTSYVNPRMAELLGYTPAEMRGRRFSEFVPAAGVRSAEDGFQQRKHGVPQRAECELVRKDGSTVWVHYAGTPLSDGSRFLGALAVVTDISEGKRNEMTIRRQAEELARANQQKEDFLAMLGHELRNALAPVAMAVKVMALKGDKTFVRERAIIDRQVGHLVQLVDDISDVSRFMRGKLLVRPEAVDLAELVREAVDGVSVSFSHKAHTVDVDVATGLAVRGDGRRLHQVLVNLLTNAAKYTPAKGRIRVTGTADGDRVVVAVRDNGAGIAPDFLPLIFQPFSQKAETLDRAEGGLGLGLAIVQAIVQAHGGTVTARSDGPGHGSEFIVSLPAGGPAGSSARETAPDVVEQL